MRKLYVRSTDNLYRIYDLIRLLLHSLLTFFRNRQHRSGTERISRMHAQWIDIFNKAYRDHIALCITNYLKLQLFPSENRLLYKHLSHKTCLQSSCTYSLQFFLIIDKSAAGTAHSISRTQYHRIAQLISNRKCFVYRIRNLASRHFHAKLIHRLLKLDAVFPTFDRIHLHTDNLYIIFIKNSFFV